MNNVNDFILLHFYAFFTITFLNDGVNVRDQVDADSAHVVGDFVLPEAVVVLNFTAPQESSRWSRKRGVLG